MLVVLSRIEELDFDHQADDVTAAVRDMCSSSIYCEHTHISLNVGVYLCEGYEEKRRRVFISHCLLDFFF